MVKFLSGIYTGAKNVLGFESEPVRREGGSPRSTGGGQSGVSSYSDRNPTPKPIGGPLTNLGDAGITALSKLNPMNLYTGLANISGDIQDISGKTQRSAGDFFDKITGAPGAVIEGATAPVGQLSKDVLPLAAIAAAVLLLRK